MAKSDNQNLINIQSDTQFPDESNPTPILPTNDIDSHEQNPCLKTSINLNSNANPSSSSLDSCFIVAGLNNKIIGARNDVEDVKTKEKNGELKESIAVMEVVNVEKSDNTVLRKHLRVTRYFDPPDNNWGNCSNCRGTGHTVSSCTAAKRRKPCYLCASLQHIPKHCRKLRVCPKCKQGAHRAKNCPEKSAEGLQNTILCLKCGDSGHEMLTCRTAYSPDDLKEIQCYICKCFGHLSCLDYGRDLGVVSCYKCGQLGHTGSKCTHSSAQPHEEPTNTPLRRLCKKCDEEGHKTCKCKTVKPKRRRRKRHLKEKKEDVGVKSAPHELDESRKRIKTENGSPNSSQPKRRVKWFDEDHGGYQNGTHQGSPSTPVTYRPKYSFHERYYPPRFQYEASGIINTAIQLPNLVTSNHESREDSWDY